MSIATKTPARPKRNDPAIREAAIAKIAAACAEWDMGADATDACIEGWKVSLARHDLNADGYELARNLENRDYVSPDRELVEILDDASHALWTAHEAAVRQWAKATGWTPRYKVGDRFVTRHGAGCINQIDAERAIYLFKPDDEAEKFARGGGIHITDEELAVAEQSA